MSVKVAMVDTLKAYFSKVVERAEHHAPNVNEIIYALIGIIILKMDEQTNIEVRGTSSDSTGNILWVHIKGKRYAFRYEHALGGSIEVHENNYNGPIVLAITNTTPISHILGIF